MCLLRRDFSRSILARICNGKNTQICNAGIRIFQRDIFHPISDACLPMWLDLIVKFTFLKSWWLQWPRKKNLDIFHVHEGEGHDVCGCLYIGALFMPTSCRTCSFNAEWQKFLPSIFQIRSCMVQPHAVGEPLCRFHLIVGGKCAHARVKSDYCVKKNQGKPRWWGGA